MILSFFPSFLPFSFTTNDSRRIRNFRLGSTASRVRRHLSISNIPTRDCVGSMSEWKSDGVPRGLLDPDNTSFWREQKRFVLKCLRDYGFGKKSEQNIQDEAKALINHIIENNDSEYFLIKNVFNISSVNVIWKIVANETFSLDSEEGRKYVESLEAVLMKVDPKVSIPVFGKYTTVFKNRVKQANEIKRGLGWASRRKNWF